MEPVNFTVIVPFQALDQFSPGPVLRSTVSEVRDSVALALRSVAREDFVVSVDAKAMVLRSWDEHPIAASYRGKKRTQSLARAVPLLVEVDGKVEPDRLRSGDNADVTDLGDIDLMRIAESEFECLAVRSLSDLLLAACIARPGSFDTLQVGTGKTRERFNADYLRFCLEPECRKLADEYGWPPISDLSVRKVYKWLRGIEGFECAFGRGPLGRAVAAFSYIASAKHQVAGSFLWPLVGLEALYGREKDGLQRQILDKSELFLGPRREFKGKFREMYEKRSQFVHGTVDMPFAYSPWEASPDYEKFDTEFYAMASLGIAVLVASLQKLALEDRQDLEFHYQRATESKRR